MFGIRKKTTVSVFINKEDKQRTVMGSLIKGTTSSLHFITSVSLRHLYLLLKCNKKVKRTEQERSRRKAWLSDALVGEVAPKV